MLDSTTVGVTRALFRFARVGTGGRRGFLQKMACFAFGAFAGLATMSRVAFAGCAIDPLSSFPCGNLKEEDRCENCPEGWGCDPPPATPCPEGLGEIDSAGCGPPVGSCGLSYVYAICEGDCWCAYDITCCCFE